MAALPRCRLAGRSGSGRGGDAKSIVNAHSGPVVAGRAVNGVGDAGMIAPQPSIDEP